ncbi:hypothetical protein QBC40DRAFT_23084 [Triangularia verruculosa]|uniref:Uncharacterized protein n=1 Tax=Triangularia verruculosa TaxID=2587418 RepID=A0AAN6X848_9PEZI|nr:hypothetical protein QBC40DRAFT_23084 [Triangularia verruculosa]
MKAITICRLAKSDEVVWTPAALSECVTAPAQGGPLNHPPHISSPGQQRCGEWMEGEGSESTSPCSHHIGYAIQLFWMEQSSGRQCWSSSSTYRPLLLEWNMTTKNTRMVTPTSSNQQWISKNSQAYQARFKTAFPEGRHCRVCRAWWTTVQRTDSNHYVKVFPKGRLQAEDFPAPAAFSAPSKHWRARGGDCYRWGPTAACSEVPQGCPESTVPHTRPTVIAGLQLCFSQLIRDKAFVLFFPISSHAATHTLCIDRNGKRWPLITLSVSLHTTVGHTTLGLGGGTALYLCSRHEIEFSKLGC